MEEMSEDDQTTASISLPQDCLSTILSLTSPRDAVRALAVSSCFNVASQSDTTWERFLPSDYQRILSMFETPLIYSSKRELFFLLSDSPILFDGGTKCFWLAKSSGKKCYMLCANAFLISKKKSPTNWRWTYSSDPKSRFPQVIELLSVSFLRIQCNIQTEILSPKTNYSVYLVFTTTRNCYGLDSEFKGSVRYIAGSGKCMVNNGYDIWSVYLTTPKQRSNYGDDQRRMGRKKKELDSSFYPKKRMNDGWMEIFLGEILFLNHDDDGEIEIQLFEKRNGVLKSGLIIEGIEIRPSLSDP